MSLQQAFASGPRIKPTTSRILTLDIERLPGLATHEHRGLTITGPFWDLSGWKSTIGYRLPPSSVTRWPRNICVAWRWYGEKKVNFAAEWDDDGPDGMARTIWEQVDQADIIIGHNVASFDMKKLKSQWILAGLPAPRPYKTVDTLTIARRELGFESNTLDSLCERMGLPGKVDKYDPECAEAAVAGDIKAQRRMKRYNVADVEASECLYDAMRGWIPNHPFMGTHGDKPVCNQCASTDVVLQPTRYRAVVLDYSLWKCEDCGGFVRGGWVARAANTRGIG